MKPGSPTQDPQTDLPLFQVSAEDPNVAWLEGYLKEHPAWMRAGELVVLVNKPDSDDSRRWLRALAQASGWVISGQKGYRHLEHATAEEVNHFTNWMESQGKKMFERAALIRRNAHSVLG